MYSLQVCKKTIVQAVKRIHNQRVRNWKESGSNGLKPKLYSTTEDIFKRGLEHPDFSTEKAQSGSAM